MTNNELIFLGGTGALGQEIGKGLITTEGFDAYKAVVRSPDSEAARALQRMGWTLQVVDDMRDVEKMVQAMAGAKTVVSTFGGDSMVELEMIAMEAAKIAGAILYVPSQFGIDYRRFGTSFPIFAGKKQALEKAEELGLPTLKVFTGCFSDIIFGYLTDLENATTNLIGDLDGGTMSFTRRSDIGYVLAKALQSPKYNQGGFLSLQADTMTWKAAVELLGTLTGKSFTFEPMTVEAAKQMESELLAQGMQGDMSAFMGAFCIHLMATPASGNSGADVSGESDTLGVTLESLETTIKKVYV